MQPVGYSNNRTLDFMQENEHSGHLEALPMLNPRLMAGLRGQWNVMLAPRKPSHVEAMTYRHKSRVVVGEARMCARDARCEDQLSHVLWVVKANHYGKFRHVLH